MVYGGEDRELGERLTNAGISGIGIRYRAAVVQLDHPRSYVSTDGISANDEIRRTTRMEQRTWTTYGVVREDRRHR